MALFSDLKGTSLLSFVLNLTGVRLKDSSGNLLVRNNADDADAAITASQLNNSGDSIVINSDSAGSAADWKITVSRPASGMTADWALTLPVDDGAPGQVLQTNGSGVTTWATSSTTADCIHSETTSLAFGTSSPVTMFTLPANAVVHYTEVVIDTPFNGTSPTVSIGVAGTVSKFTPATAINLKGVALDTYSFYPGLAAEGSTNDLIATYAASSASAGAARLIVYYSIPA